METFFGALGTVVALFVALRAKFRSEVRDVRGELRGLRDEIRGLRAELGRKIDRLSDHLLQHIQQGHPPH